MIRPAGRAREGIWPKLNGLVKCKEAFVLSTPYFWFRGGEWGLSNLLFIFLKAPTNILIVTKIPLVAQILGKGFKEKTRKRGTLSNDQKAEECAVEQSLDVDCSHAPVSYENETSC